MQVYLDLWIFLLRSTTTPYLYQVLRRHDIIVADGLMIFNELRFPSQQIEPGSTKSALWGRSGSLWPKSL